jgi:hypothetical protein
MWLGWLFFVLTSIMQAIYLTGNPKLNTSGRPFGIFAICMFLIPIMICGCLRFWVSRIRNPWFVLLPYFIGVIVAQLEGLFGVFLLPEFLILFQFLSAVLFLAYIPFFVRLTPSVQSNTIEDVSKQA